MIMTTTNTDQQVAESETPKEKWEVFTRRGSRKRNPMSASQRVARRAARLRRENRCITCGHVAAPSNRSRAGFSKFCLKHLKKARETKRAEMQRARKDGNKDAE